MDALEFVVSIVAMTLTAITIWIVLLRRDKQKVPSPTSADFNMNELSAMAESMGERIDVLESILDAEVPDLREQNEQPSE